MGLALKMHECTFSLAQALIPGCGELLQGSDDPLAQLEGMGICSLRTMTSFHTYFKTISKYVATGSEVVS